MKSLEDLFSKPGGSMPMIIILAPHGNQEGSGKLEDQVELGTPFSFRDGMATDSHGDNDVPLDHPSDCSTFIANLIAHLTGDKVRLPDLTDAQIPETEPVAPGDERAGDLLFSKYPGQGPIDWGHVAMMLDRKGDTPDQWMALEQSEAPGLTTGRPGVDVRQADHAIDQGGQMIVRRVPGLERFLGHR